MVIPSRLLFLFRIVLAILFLSPLWSGELLSLSIGSLSAQCLGGSLWIYSIGVNRAFCELVLQIWSFGIIFFQIIPLSLLVFSGSPGHMYLVNVMMSPRPFRFCLFSFIHSSFYSSQHFQSKHLQACLLPACHVRFPVDGILQISVPLPQSQPHNCVCFFFLMCVSWWTLTCFMCDFLLLSFLFLPSFLSFLINFTAVVLRSLTRSCNALTSLASVHGDVFFFLWINYLSPSPCIMTGFVEKWEFQRTSRSVDWLHVSGDPQWPAKVQGPFKSFEACISYRSICLCTCRCSTSYHMLNLHFSKSLLGGLNILFYSSAHCPHS